MKEAFLKPFINTLYKKPEQKKRQNKGFRALNNITLSIKHGDRVGIIGKNGAGKSTLLKVMATIYPPTSGDVSIKGRISSLLNMNVGLHPSATGYENIVSLGLLLGRKKQEMVDLFPQITEFTELGNFLKAPIKTYSTGMKLRLSFSVVTSINPDILLLDEIIGVGDSVFKTKAKKRLDELIGKSSVLVIASHDLSNIKKLCNKIIVMDKGKNLFFGKIDEGITVYNNLQS